MHGASWLAPVRLKYPVGEWAAIVALALPGDDFANLVFVRGDAPA